MKVTLIRHTSVDVPRGTCYGQSDVPLRDSFEEEAKVVKARLSGRSFDKVYTSPLSRCVKLAEYCGYGNAERDERIMELNFGDWEMHLFDDIKDPRLQEWYDNYLHVCATNGESFDDQLRRVSDFLNELQHAPYQNVAVFTHGGVLICAEIYTGQIREEEAFNALLPYGSELTIEL